MPLRQIDSFRVKPSGILQSWRGRVVYFNEDTFEITSECPSSGQCMNLSNIGDYKHKDRRYNEGDTIQEFCSIINSSRIKIIAQNEAPFAAAQVTPFSPLCGFVEPDAPPTPFGDPAAYGLYKEFEAFGKGKYFRVEVAKKNYAGAVTVIPSGPDTAIRLRYENGGSNSTKTTNAVTPAQTMDFKFWPIVSTELELTFVTETNDEHRDLLTDDEREYLVTVKVKPSQLSDDNLYTIEWVGFLMPDGGREPFRSAPYEVSLRCTEVLNTLKNIPYPMPKAITKDPKQSLLAAIAYCLYSTNLALPFYTTDNLYEFMHNKGMDDDPLEQTLVNPFRFTTEDGSIMSCYEVLMYIAKQRGARVFQSGGAFHFERVIEKSKQTVNRRKYTYRGLFLFSEQINQVRNAGLRKEVEHLNYNANILSDAAYKAVAVNWKFGYAPSIILNGNFEQYNDLKFDYWATVGGLAFSRTQKSIKNSVGTPILLDDYMFTFDQPKDLAKHVQPNPIRVAKGDKVTLYMNIDSLGPIDIFYFRARIGTWYAGNTDGAIGDKIGWSTDFATCRRVLSGTKDPNVYQLAIDLGVMPIPGPMYLEFIGFDKYKQSGRTNSGGARPTDPGVPLELIPAPYTPVSIDNVSVTINRDQFDANIPKGFTYLSQQERVFTTIAEPLEVLFGDVKTQVRSRGGEIALPTDRPTRGDDYMPGQIGILYRKDGGYTEKWSDGIFPHDSLNAILAKSILTAYQRPGNIFEGDFLSADLNFLNTLELDLLPDQLYMFLSAEFDLLNNKVERAIVAEIISKSLKTIDGTFPTLPNGLPPLVQNPNTVTPLPPTGTKIFAPQFNEVFS